MLNKQYIKELRKSFHEYALIRRDVIKNSGDALHHAKRAIFSIHRGNLEEAEGKLHEAEKLLKDLQKKYKNKIIDEGSFRAGLEEYVEAVSFFDFVTKRKINKVVGLSLDPEVYLSGLCDVPGELYRYAIRAATNKDMQTVNECLEASEEIIGELIEFDLTSYLRNKFDQAKSSRNRLEIVHYELSLRMKE